MSFATGTAIVGYYLGSRREPIPPPTLGVFSEEELVAELWSRFSDYHVHIIGAAILIVLCVAIVFAKTMRWFFRKCKEYGKVVHYDSATVVSSLRDPIYHPEKYVPGSDYQAGVEPPCQVDIYKPNGQNEFNFLGCGFRYGDLLVTAYHVVGGISDLRLVRGDKFVDITFDDNNEHPIDLIAIKVPAAKWTQIAVKSAKLPKMALQNNTVAVITSRGMSTFGMLSCYPHGPYLQYAGSTKPGYSGAPLVVGNMVYGMHVGHGAVNMAIDANWIAEYLKKDEFRGESSEDFLYAEIEKQFKRTGKKTRYSTFNGEDLWILSGGKYHMVASEDVPDYVYDLMDYDAGDTSKVGRRPEHGESTERRIGDVQYADVEPRKQLRFTGEETVFWKTASAIAEADRLKSGPRDVVSNPTMVTIAEPSISQAPRKERMGGQGSTVAQPSAVSSSMRALPVQRESLTANSARTRRRRQKKSPVVSAT